MGGDPDRTTEGSLPGAVGGDADCFIRLSNSGVTTIQSVRQSKMTQNQARVFSKSIQVNHCQQTVEISAPAIGRPAVRTSGGFYRGNIESFSETGPSSSFMFQHDSVSFFRSDYAVVIIEVNCFFFLFYFMYFSYRPTLGEEPPELVGTSFCHCCL